MRFIVADDHQLILKGIKDIIDKYFPSVICDAVNSLPALRTALHKSTYDLLLLDVRLGRDDARLFTKDLTMTYPKMPILILSSLDDTVTISTLMSQGVGGYILKTDDEEEIVNGIKQVLKGETFLSKKLKDLFVNRNLNLKGIKPQVKLSKREKEILQLIVRECSTKEIAEILFLSTKTIENYRGNLLMKFEAKNVAGLVKKAILAGFI